MGMSREECAELFRLSTGLTVRPGVNRVRWRYFEEENGEILKRRVLDPYEGTSFVLQVPLAAAVAAENAKLARPPKRRTDPKRILKLFRKAELALQEFPAFEAILLEKVGSRKWSGFIRTLETALNSRRSKKGPKSNFDLRNAIIDLSQVRAPANGTRLTPYQMGLALMAVGVFSVAGDHPDALAAQKVRDELHVRKKRENRLEIPLVDPVSIHIDLSHIMDPEALKAAASAADRDFREQIRGELISFKDSGRGS